MSKVRKYEQKAREEKLAKIREQVEAGTLVIRKMTAAERKKWGVK